MFITVTIRMEASSKDELTNVFAGHVKACKKHFEELKKEGVFGEPVDVAMRYLVVGGSYHPPEVADESVQEHGTPTLED